MKIPYKRQSLDYSCGPAVVRMALGAFGMRISEQAAAKELGTNWRTGTTHRAFMRVLGKRGFRVRERRGASVALLQKNIQEKSVVVVHYLEPEENVGHYAIVAGVTKTNVVLHDPWHGARFNIKKREFLHRWWSGNRKHRKWMLVVSR